MKVDLSLLPGDEVSVCDLCPCWILLWLPKDSDGSFVNHSDLVSELLPCEEKTTDRCC